MPGIVRKIIRVLLKLAENLIDRGQLGRMLHLQKLNRGRRGRDDGQYILALSQHPSIMQKVVHRDEEIGENTG
jgi:hypothetical protein